MKSFLSACFFVCVASTLVASQMVSATKCVEQAECEEGQCCSGVPPFGGICRNLTIAGAKCHLVDRVVPIFGDFVIGPCPCAEGLVCIQQGKKKNDGTCQLPPTTPAPTVPAEEPASVADDTPVEEPAVDDTPVEEPAVDDTPVEEPAVDDTPVEEPAADDTPVEEPAEEPAAVADGSSASDAAADDASAADAGANAE